PLVARGPEPREGAEPRRALLQPAELGRAGLAGPQVRAGLRGARLDAGLAQRGQLLQREVRAHAGASSPSQRRSRWCARASWDLEKLVVLPIRAAISSWV